MVLKYANSLESTLRNIKWWDIFRFSLHRAAVSNVCLNIALQICLCSSAHLQREGIKGYIDNDVFSPLSQLSHIWWNTHPHVHTRHTYTHTHIHTYTHTHTHAHTRGLVRTSPTAQLGLRQPVSPGSHQNNTVCLMNTVWPQGKGPG